MTMFRTAVFRLYLLGSALIVTCAQFGSSYYCDKTYPCDCKTLEQCKPIVANKHRKEVIVLAKDKDVTSKTYLHWDWRNITVVYTENFHDPELMCHAHKQGARYGLRYVLKNITAFYDTEFRENFTKGLIFQSHCTRNDAINLDIDVPLAQDSNDSRLLVSVLRDIRNGFDDMIGNFPVVGDGSTTKCQLSFSVPWMPYCFDDMCLPEAEMADIVDLFIIKSDHIHGVHDWGGNCTAGAHAPFAQILYGYTMYMSVNMPVNQMVLSVPWYGYKYRCTYFDPKTNRCIVSPKPFHGVNCSYATGERLSLAKILAIKVQYNASRLWHSGYRTPYFNYKNTTDGYMYQVWYEDEQSTWTKYAYSKEANFKGIAVWYGDSLEYNSSQKEIQNFTYHMWEAVDLVEAYKYESRACDEQLPGMVTGIAASMFLCGTLVGIGLGALLTKFDRKRKKTIAQEQGDTDVLTEMMETEHKTDATIRV
ncbi:di-N-acetylchitobiase isoform X1 [Lingula anatina]|uniref:Di-N-acetylchitobiase isoform X1 n=1 Tax=Lingula anatina TaxID=7574 RepID=A0A1S3IGA9_LINAN|nr:di-N-acetylchitobiase isoform X1 [Lingula anatina]XP_013397157.1 di-N-acetylchitobiase isoform X1 [Lingula anatina]XP_013397164.1 di-N-acetylchitobiase isoform X1 [Lingula anatina]XP_013397173.1 di-N-acetylchitobiase isoform X1 [Lingula anatina]XP_013397181.1 di-N-acetylchitobiase isoform X2 [Lingula anatina]XP_013397190.1 di-N-acetylchitobiase isoform X2 [Lingula anatina]XP_013397197.1 di-N-acetylchitobiase isoform X2 [Lingula anatina]XP_013397203.1 di-N-acetylchitobiase isoform X2 [Ling|eukprot:XP_013397146.1 di-N-acetylchitobiase isoform X1 [Lingula anatina]